jgi:hypothetical protein
MFEPSLVPFVERIFFWLSSESSRFQTSKQTLKNLSTKERHIQEWD